MQNEMQKKKSRFLFLILSLVVLGTMTLGAGDALALTALKQVQVSDASRVDLLFDGKVSRSQIRTEFFRDIIQISLNDVSVYPAKISSVSGGDLTKIFAYQYAPKLVRCRLTVKGKAESYKNRIVLSSGGPGGEMLTIRLNGAAGSSMVRIRDADERALLDHVMKAKDPGASASPADAPADAIDTITEKSAAPAKGIGGPPTGSSATGAAATQSIVNTEDRPLNLDGSRDHNAGNQLGGASGFPSPLSALAKLAFVIGLFSVVALAVKKFWKPGEKGTQDTPLIGAIGRFARKNLGSKVMGSKKMAIEILANHHIGPKKSIAVIKVGGRTMVVGITEQAINLISQLSPDSLGEEDTMNALAELDSPPLEETTNLASAPKSATLAGGPAVFSKMLQSETAKPSQPKRDVRVTSYGNSSAPTDATVGNVSAAAAASLSGVRAQIRSKLEGLKQI